MHLFYFKKIEHEPLNKGYLIILKDANNKKLSILIGSNEAQSLSLTYEKVQLTRPRTNDLLINLVNQINGNFESIVINKYEKGVFYAKINMERLTV